MKDKNRFSILLEHLMAIAELKNSILAKAVQYDDSYISKWISGKLLPTEKNHENTLQAISPALLKHFQKKALHNCYRNISYRTSMILKLLFMTISNLNICM